MSVVEQGGRSTATRGLGAWLAGIAPPSARGNVTVAILPDTKVRQLNSAYRHIDEATDVLSFPVGEQGSGAHSAKLPGKRQPFLGEIVIARGIARKHARILGHPVGIELRVLALHGLLHLLGYDHQNDNGRMARLEARLRRKAGLPLGLIARSS